MSRRSDPGPDHPAVVLAELRRQLDHASQVHRFYPVRIQRAWYEDRYVCVVYHYWGREESYGLCRDVFDPEGLADESGSEDAAMMIRVGDLEEPPPVEGIVLGSDDTHWWGSVGPDVPRGVWDRPVRHDPSATYLTVQAGSSPTPEQIAAVPNPGWLSRCPRCAAATELDDGVRGCESCAVEGVAMPLVPARAAAVPVSLPPTAVAGVGPMWRWSALLPPVGSPVSLGEGGTPLVDVDLDDVPGRVLLKDERANPTGSFKERLASAAVSRARHVGASTVATASSGNAGMAVAAYAAAAGLSSIVFAAEPGLPSPTADAVAGLGTRVVTTATFADRWTAVRTGAERLGWFPITNYLMPPVSSHPVGVHACRTIAYEIAETLRWSVPDWVVVPISRGDGLFGVWAGFVEMAELGWTGGVPKLLAVERYPSLTDALARGLEQPVAMKTETVRATSIADPQGTAMSAHALRASGGHAVACDDDQIARAWSRLASRGVLLEFSSAAAVHGVETLRNGGLLDESATVVLLATAGPYAQPSLADPPTAVALDDPTDVDALRAAVTGDVRPR